MVNRPEPDPDMASIASPWPPSSSGWACITCACARVAACYGPPGPWGGTRRYSADDLHRLRRISELLDAGLNFAEICMVLDLQDQNTHLEDKNTQLRADRADEG